MTSKEQILARIRQALKRESPEPHWLHEPAGDGPLFPLPDGDPQSLLGAFRAELESLFGEVHAFAKVEDANAWLHEAGVEQIESVPAHALDGADFRNDGP